ncbi:MAG TPA: GNAT family protein [Thermoanaerobaculia bacterium]|nr:GNAT family protein [Thermoanaerobaculia bacterium]
MTFYNIVFGLLFIGAFREVIFALAKGPDWKLFCLAATLSVLVFSDTIYTALVIEGKKHPYTHKMKLLDLSSFILLSFAVVILNPTTNDMFEVDVTAVLAAVVRKTGWSPEALFWGLLALYMVNLVFWNWLLGIHRVMWHYRWVKWLQPVLMLVFALMAAVAWRAAEPDAALYYARWAVLVVMVAYLLWFKRHMSEALDAIVTLEPLTEKDVSAIRNWPPYPEPMDVLDYALRPGGWLDQYPESPTNVRYGIWQKGELVGFSLLTDVKDGSAEFYIALHAGKTRNKLGQEGTAQTVRRGFQEHRLNRIHLKVRDWYGARKVYARVGFKVCGEIEEPVQGKPVKFVRMELYRPQPSFKDRSTPSKPPKKSPKPGPKRVSVALGLAVVACVLTAVKRHRRSPPS